jgi:PhnB protein
MANAVYLMFNGTCEEALNFYKETLGGELGQVQRYGDVPGSGSESAKDRIMHAVMQVGGLTLMFSDADEKRNVSFGDNFSIVIDCKSDGDLRRIFDTLATGGEVTMPVQETFWGATFGMCRDKYGVNWMLNYEKDKQ